MGKHIVSRAEIAAASCRGDYAGQVKWLEANKVPFRHGPLIPIIRRAEADPGLWLRPAPPNPIDVVFAKAGSLMGRVYIVDEGDDDAPVKVGFATTSVGKRVSALQTGNHRMLRVVYTERAPCRVEGHIHALLEQSRVNGEWFARTAAVCRFIHVAARSGYRAAFLDAWASRQIL